ncbi:hypothetical protein [Sphingomonas sp. VL_57B]|uniref:hypothetical protein n=1 Tax=Sphingomonas sp. VL_57B TaxID=3144220 RepID=UPI0031F4CC9C
MKYVYKEKSLAVDYQASAGEQVSVEDATAMALIDIAAALKHLAGSTNSIRMEFEDVSGSLNSIRQSVG